MGLKDLFKRKPKVVEPTKEEKKELLLTEIVTELRNLGYSDEQIIKKFEEKNYPKEFIDFLIKSKQEVKMPKEEVEDFEDEEELEDSEESEDEDLDEETAQEKEFDKKKKSESKPVKEKPTETKVTLDGLARDLQVVAQMVSQVSQRLESVEATLFRMRSA